MKWYLNIKGGKIIGAYAEKLLDGLVEYESDENFDRTKYKYSNGEVIKISEQERNTLYKEELSIEQETMLEQMMVVSARTSVLIDIPDNEATKVPLCYDDWNDYPNGYPFEENKDRVRYNGERLWKCKKSHKKQADLYPGADPTLWEQLDKEQHAGTIEDPIPVPDSVTTSGFTYIYGKYYSESNQKYLFKRGGIPDEQAEAMYGKSETLYFPPSALVGSYTEVVS